MPVRWLQRVRWMLLTVALAGAVSVGGIVLLRDEHARAETPAIDFELYLRRTDGRRADPVNLVFIGESNATAIALKLSSVMHWTPVAGSSMSFITHGETRWTEVQLGVNLGGGTRQHMRVAGADEVSETWGPYALAGVHLDVPVGCGHRGANFDELRDTVAKAMEQAGYQVSRRYLGNDGQVVHCDGSVTHGDGWAIVIDLRKENASQPTPKPTPPPTPVITPSPTAVPAATPVATAVPTPTATPSPTPTATPAPTPAPTPTPAVPPERE